jgi:A/G-specific adenine glycosylase
MADAPRHRSAIQHALLRWHDANALRAPWRESGDPYHALVAAVMAQQTQMSRVLLLYERFLAAYPTIEALAAASLGDVIRAWKGMGYNQRAVRLHRAARTIAAGGWPRDAASLARIEGVGPFTAAIIASFAFGRPAAAVDTNVVRVLTRLTGDDTLRGRRLQIVADEMVPVGDPARWNQALMDYGARVCVSRPKCGECVVARWCAARERFAAPVPSMVAETRAAYRLPGKREPKFETTPRYFRGRIIDVLRDLPPGQSITLPALAKAIANGHAAPATGEVGGWVAALETAGLCAVRRGRVSLPP